MKSNDLRTEKLLYIRNLHCTFLKHGFIGHSVHVECDIGAQQNFNNWSAILILLVVFFNSNFYIWVLSHFSLTLDVSKLCLLDGKYEQLMLLLL